MKQLKLLWRLPPYQVYEIIRHKFAKRQQVLPAMNEDLPHCIFVLSTGRVGTQTLTALMHEAKNLLAYHEPLPKLYGLSKLAYLHQNNTAIDEVLIEAFKLARTPILARAKSSNQYYMETGPQVTFLAHALLKSQTDVKFIHLVRDPREVVRSGMRRKWYDGHQMDATRIVPRQGTADAARWDHFTPFQKNLWLWAETNQWILEFSKNLSLDQVKLVHAEDIFNGHEATIKDLFTFINSPMPPRSNIERVLQKKLNSQQKGTFLEHNDWSHTMKEDLRAIAGEVTKKMGYELP